MSAVGVVCLITTFVLVIFSFPASVVARTGPGTPYSTETKDSYLERTPVPSASSAHAKAADLITQSTEDLRVAPQDVDSIFKFFHRTIKGSFHRRGLVGSSPPTCKAKCGACQPCKAVHVAIGSPHGVISETEYYPEVWRCQCGNRYYMP